MSNIYRCCKPFLDSKCSSKFKNLSESCKHRLNKLFQTDRFKESKRICVSCYFILGKEFKNFKANNSDEDLNNSDAEDIVDIAADNSEDDVQTSYVPQAGPSSARDAVVTPTLTHIERYELINNINTKILPHLLDTVSPIRKKFCDRQDYTRRKSHEVAQSIQHSLENLTPHKSDDIEKKAKHYDEIMKNLKFQYVYGDNMDKRRILALLPLDMTHQEIKGIFGEDVTYHAVKKGKECQRNLCAFSAITRPNFNRHILSDTLRSIVITFYEDDEISRMMPGLEDSISVRVEGNRQHFQKRLMLSSLKEAYLEFKKRNPCVKVGFEKFISLRRKHCIKLGVGNQQNVCVCAFHQI